LNQTLSYYDKKELHIVVIAETHFPDVPNQQDQLMPPTLLNCK
jgi:hypothetical protein